MEWEGREQSGNVEDRRSFGKAGLAIGGGAGLLIVIVGALLGVDPSQLANLVGGGGDQQQGTEQRQETPEEKKMREFTATILRDTEVIWDEQFKKIGQKYKQPKLVLFSGQVNSACGHAEAAMGPFYCPADEHVYIDLSFYHEMDKKLNAPGEFPRAYVIAHEVGHHVQHLLGYPDRAKQVEQGDANRASVRMELQADYLAGVWAHHGQAKWKFINEKDMMQAIHAAHQIGDDWLRQQAGRAVVPEKFTHGSSNQRMYWFQRGFQTGSLKDADLLVDLPFAKLDPPPDWRPSS
jgi:predicted metalloprotease